MSTTLPNRTEPAWDIARLFPDQGHWAEEDYLFATRSTNRMVELADGRVEVLSMPTKSHQRIVLYLYNAMLAFAARGGRGELLVAPYPIRLRTGRLRQPDVVFMLAVHAHRMGESFADGADLVMEVVSDDNRTHDLVTKRVEYAEAGIPEYWIVDPRERKITVLTLRGNQYNVHACVGPGEQATSALLPGFTIDVTAVFNAAADRAAQ